MAVAVLIATWCASHFVCVCVCVHKQSHCRGDSLGTGAVAWRPAAPSLVPPVSPAVYMTYIHHTALCARKASLNGEKTLKKNPHECINIPELQNQRTVSLMQN